MIRAGFVAALLLANVAWAADVTVLLHPGPNAAVEDRLDNVRRMRDALAATGPGDTIVIPSGTYEMEVLPTDLIQVATGQFVVVGLRMTGQNLRGSGSSTLKFFPDMITFEYAAIYLDAFAHYTKMRIDALSIVGPQISNPPFDENASGTAGIYWQGALATGPDALTLSDVTVNGGRWFTGVFGSNAGALSMYRVNLSALIDGVGWFGATRTDIALTITDSRIHDCGVALGSDGQPKGDLVYVHPHAALSVSNTTFGGTYRYAIYQNGSPSAPPPYCRVSGVTIEPSCAYSIQTSTSGSCTITGSKISAKARGIWARNDLIVTGNEFHYRGINTGVYNLKNAVVSGNSFYLDDPTYSGGMIQADAIGAHWTVTGNTVIGMQSYPNIYAQASYFFSQTGAGSDSRLSGNVSNGLYVGFANIRAGMAHVNDNTIVGPRFALYLTATPTLIEFKDNYTNVLSGVAMISAQTPPSVLLSTDNLNAGAQ